MKSLATVSSLAVTLSKSSFIPSRVFLTLVLYATLSSEVLSLPFTLKVIDGLCISMGTCIISDTEHSAESAKPLALEKTIIISSVVPLCNRKKAPSVKPSDLEQEEMSNAVSIKSKIVFNELQI
jgi:hypothetical protein